ncbi:MAG: YceD family protein [Woeseiaceae bacterium]|nr:YceD family protein [Woeseiaceae bacterium]
MGSVLTDRRTPRELAANGQVIEIASKIGSFERLADLVEADLAALDEDAAPADWRDSPVTGRLEFGFADDRDSLPMVTGDAQATVCAVCQRCLEPMQLVLDARLEYLLADGDFEGLEVWELEEATLRPLDLVDEALVMAVPMIVLHDDEDGCSAMTAEAEDADDKIRPFAALREQMEQLD